MGRPKHDTQFFDILFGAEGDWSLTQHAVDERERAGGVHTLDSGIAFEDKHIHTVK